MQKFRNIYRIPSARLSSWNYAWNKSYFITICTKHHEHYFGSIVNKTLSMSAIGAIVKEEWLKSRSLRQDMNIEIGKYVIMPNHFHGIITIGKNKYNSYTYSSKCSRDAMPRVSDVTGKDVSCKNKFSAQSKNMASIIRGFKSAVTIRSRKLIFDFSWQPRYYDVIIRDESMFKKIEYYIINNPKNWKDDKFYN